MRHANLPGERQHPVITSGLGRNRKKNIQVVALGKEFNSDTIQKEIARFSARKADYKEAEKELHKFSAKEAETIRSNAAATLSLSKRLIQAEIDRQFATLTPREQAKYKKWFGSPVLKD